MAIWDEQPEKEPRGLIRCVQEELSPFAGVREQERPFWLQPRTEPERTGIPGDQADWVRDQIRAGRLVRDDEIARTMLEADYDRDYDRGR